MREIVAQVPGVHGMSIATPFTLTDASRAHPGMRNFSAKFIAACILGFAVLVIATRDTVHSVLFLVLDFLFVAARVANRRAGAPEVPWEPGAR